MGQLEMDQFEKRVAQGHLSREAEFDSEIQD